MTTTKVNSEFIAINAISGTIIADGAITSTHLAANSVDSSELVTGSIDTIHIAANQITATKIVTNGVLTRHISDDQITADKLANSINTDIAAKLPLAGGTMTGDLITTGLTVDTTTLVVDKTNNRVGIGTASPVQVLHLGGASNKAIQITSATSNAGYFGVYQDQAGFTVNRDASNGTFADAGKTEAAIVLQSQNADSYIMFRTTPTNNAEAPERMRIDKDGKVGIGTSSPDNTLHVYKGSAGSVMGNGNSPLTVENDTANYIQMLAPDASESGILFGNPTSNVNAGIIYSGYNGDVQFRNANNTTRVSISSTGAMTRPNHPCFDVTTSTGSTTGTIAFNTVNIDNNSNYSTSNGRFTAPVAGSYMFYTQFIKQNSNAVMRRRFDKNGVGALNGREIRLDAANAYDYGSMTIIIDLAVGDYVTVNQHTGTAHGGETYEAFGGHLIG